VDHLVTELGQLCTACARCCNGTVFSATALEHAEQQLFGCRELPQPCPHLGADRRCGVYPTRPKGCAAFLCPLANALRQGSVTLEQALARLPLTRGLPTPE
jgi:Fe-S-cluster containining protein